MSLIFGLDIGTTSIGFAVVDHDPDRSTGSIRRLGVRIFPEARDPDGTPLNQERRAARLRRRQLRRRRDRRRLLGDLLCSAGLLPTRGSPEWDDAMKSDPYVLRKRAFEGDTLPKHEIGRAIYHLAKHRHFKGREIDEISDDSESGDQKKDAVKEKDEREAKTGREAILKALEQDDVTLGAWLARRGPHERKRGEHAAREIVEKEFDKVWAPLLPEDCRDSIREAIFNQRPVFWRKSTLGKCRFVPDAPLCPKGSWLSQQKRMLEKLNNLQIAGGTQRPLDNEERAAILDRLQTQASMKWTGVRAALKALYKSRGEAGAEKRLKFNLEEGGEKTLLGNAVEAKLAKVFGADWQSDHPCKQDIRDAVHDRIWQADYERIGRQRVAILPAVKRKARRKEVADCFVEEFGISENQAAQLAELKLPVGWEPYSVEALRAFLPRLEDGTRFGALLNSPAWKDWRNKTFPNHDRPTGEAVDRLSSPVNREESRYIASLRNPTVVRTRNELRKVVNNLIGMFGKPDKIRVETAREVGNSKRQREEKARDSRRRERRRKEARKNLEENGIAQPSHDAIEKWMLWKECGHRCPYTGDCICFDALFHKDEFQVEHIWPRSRSLDDSFRNKTLCRRDVNSEKTNKTPFEYLGHDADKWEALVNRLEGMKAAKSGGMSPGKIKRFLAKSIPDGFADRQLNDTGYAAREAVAFLGRLWPDSGPEAPVKVQAVSGRVTGHLRRLWGLNNILADTGKKSRADHRHHAIDALTVACCDPSMTRKLARYWQDKDNPNPPIRDSRLSPPWRTIRVDAEKAVADIVVSHRVRKKISGPLHKKTIHGDTRKEETSKDGTTYRYFVTRKKVAELSKDELKKDIRDENVREIVKEWVDRHGGDPRKAFLSYPKRGRKGPNIRKVRLLRKRQPQLMAPAATGYAELGNNHHIAIYRLPNGDVDFDVVSMLEASQRLAKREPVVRRERGDGARLLMSLSLGDVVEFQKGEKRGLWVVHGISSAGRPTLAHINDARPASAKEAHTLKIDGTRKDFEPRFGGFMQRQPKKLSVDPIGRVRPAND